MTATELPAHPSAVFLVRDFTPNVIEPSFGIGRILYSLLEHSYWAREQDKARGVSVLGTSQIKADVIY